MSSWDTPGWEWVTGNWYTPGWTTGNSSSSNSGGTAFVIPSDDETPWQYLGRTNAVKAYGYAYNYYVLVYGKHTEDQATGKHSVTVKIRMACENASTFYDWATAGSLRIDDQDVVNWSGDLNPGSYWGNSSSITEDGVTYQRWVDMAGGTVEIDTERKGKTINIDVSWQRLPISGTPPSWLPSTTEAKATLTMELPAIEEPETEPPDDEEPYIPTIPPGRPVVRDSSITIDTSGGLAYDSMLEEYDLMGLKIEHGLNVGGTAEIVMPPGHPAYNQYVDYRTVVEISRGGVLRFRGRALYHTDNFIGQRTVKCEGELCFLRDSINRPYKYKSTPAKIFRALIRKHNEQVEFWKQFKIGNVTVTDPAGNIEMDLDGAETILDTLNKLIDKCGGYITFTSDAGERVIHYLKDTGRSSSQTIEFGENLLDFSSTGSNTDQLATGIVPFGKTDDTTKKRITIESVNGGKDYLLAPDAVALRGTILATETWDDVTDPAVLLKKAKAWLKEHKVFITTLELTALDLSYLEKNIETFTIGDKVRVKSQPHGVNADFEITKMTEDLINPGKSKITLGKEIKSLTGADVAGDFKGLSAVDTLSAKFGADSEFWSSVKEEVANSVLGDKIDTSGTDLNFLKEARFPNGSGIRIADKDGNQYYVLRVDSSNSCVVGNDYTNLYLRGKDAVYLYKTGAAVTSDRREKNGIEALPEAYEAMLDKLTPVRFKYNGKGSTYHVGFVAQDVEAALTEAGLSKADFGGFVDVAGDGTQLALAYDEFIALLLQKIRGLESRIKAMEGKT